MTCPPSMSAAMARHSHFGGFIRFSHAREPAVQSQHHRRIRRHVQDGAAPEFSVTSAAQAQIASVENTRVAGSVSEQTACCSWAQTRTLEAFQNGRPSFLVIYGSF